MTTCKEIVPTSPPSVCGAQRYRCAGCGAVGCAADPRCPRHNFTAAMREPKCKKCGGTRRVEV